MAFAPFFERIYGAVGGHLSVSRESLTKVLDRVNVGMRFEDSSRANDQWIAELTTNILARLYPRLAISGEGPRPALLRKLAQKINPAIEFTEDSPPEYTIVVGASGERDSAGSPGIDPHVYGDSAEAVLAIRGD